MQLVHWEQIRQSNLEHILVPASNIAWAAAFSLNRLAGLWMRHRERSDVETVLRSRKIHETRKTVSRAGVLLELRSLRSAVIGMLKGQQRARLNENACPLVVWSMILLVGSFINMMRRRTRCSSGCRVLRHCSLAEYLLRARGSERDAVFISCGDILLCCEAC